MSHLKATVNFYSLHSQWKFKWIIQFHEGRLVATSVAIVWRWEYCDHVAIVTPVVALHDQLMGTRHKCQAVCVVKGFRNILKGCQKLVKVRREANGILFWISTSWQIKFVKD